MTSAPDPSLPPPPAFLAGGGRAAALIAARNWSDHPMGPPEHWPEAFVSALALVLNSPESMILCWGPDLHFFFNDTYIPLLGPRVDWAMGARFDEVWADALAQAQPIIDAAFAGRPQRFVDLPWKLATDRGAADTWWSFSYSRILDRDGAIAGLFIFTNETTTAVKTEAARHEAEALLQRAQEAGGIGLFAVDDHGIVKVTSSFCRLFGLPDRPAYAIDDLATLVEPEDRPLTAVAGSRGEGAVPSDVEYRIRRADTGALRWIARKGAVERDADGTFVRFAGVVRDITDQVSIREQLTAEREQLAQMFEQAPTFMAILRGPEHRFERVNPGYVSVVGGGDLIGRTVAEALPDAVEQGFLAILDDVYRTGQPYHAAGTRYVVDTGQGEPTVRFVDFVFQPLRDRRGEVTGIFIEGADVTVRTQNARALADTEARYQALLDSIEIGFCIIGLVFDAEGRAVDYRILEANPAFREQTGLDDQIGRLVSEFAPDLERHWFDIYGQVAISRQPVRFENEAKPFGRWYDVTALPVGEPDEHRVAILFNDITQRKGLENELRRLNEGLEDEVDARTRERDRLWTISRDPFLIADQAGTWLSASPAWGDILGWPAADLVGRTSEWMEHPEDRRATRQEVARLTTEGAIARFENRFRTAAGDYRWFSWTAVREGELLFCNARDVTVEKEQAASLARAEEQLRQAQKVEAVGQLTGGVAHDFNNLLTVIRGSIDLLKRPNLSEVRRARYLEAIADTADRATRLTSQLLAFARRQALRPETFEVAHSIDALREMIDTLAGSRIAIVVEAPAERLFVDADRSQFDTAIVNMAVNARDAMDHAGRLTIATGTATTIPAHGGQPAATGDFVTVSLADTGTGILPERIGQIFEPFFSTKGPGHGTGLGLSQVFGFAVQSGGAVTVDSVPGAGATFTLYLPRVPDPGQPAVDEFSSGAPPIGSGACVLVVEDHPAVGSFAVQALAELGYATVLAEDGATALARLAEEPALFDMVFTDVVMPGISGIELAHEVRRLYPHLPVVLTSGYSTVLAEDARHGFDLLHKPYSLTELAQVLSRVISWRRPASH